MTNPTPLDTLAHDMYADRAQAELANDGDNIQAFEPGRNPDAKLLYLLGMRDLIIAMNNWELAGVGPESTGLMLEAIFGATTKAQRQAAH